jgi:hypothetical protein
MVRTAKKRGPLKALTVTGGLLVASVAPVVAQLSDSYAQVFASSDINGNDQISRAEYAHMQNLIVLQIDANDDDNIGADEWNNWDPAYMGVSYQPVDIGKIYAVMARLFVTLDRDADGNLTHAELLNGLFVEFDAADREGDGALSTEDFAGAYRLPAIVANDLQDMFGAEPG